MSALVKMMEGMRMTIMDRTCPCLNLGEDLTRDARRMSPNLRLVGLCDQVRARREKAVPPPHQIREDPPTSQLERSNSMLTEILWTSLGSAST
jgi:hypothetical protein